MGESQGPWEPREACSGKSEGFREALVEMTSKGK